jgi:endonuclease/exonuclease/phosphatase family metal-dependent hydrolase
VRTFSVIALFLFLGSLAGGCDPFGTKFSDVEDAVHYEARRIKSAPLPSVLRVMTYNIKFGGGRIDFFFDCHGDRVLMDREEVIENLEGLGEIIRDVNPDVVFLQEADVLSKRSAYVDQVQWLLDHTDLNYGVYASQWKADYVPSDGIGAVDSGNAILSKYKLTSATRIALELREDQGGLERYFYLKRNVLEADLEVSPQLRLVATHAAAYSQDGTKKEHIKSFEERLNAAPGLVIGGGDLNTLPPGTDKVRGFDDSVCTDEDFQADDYSEETDFLTGLYDRYDSAIPLGEYQSDNAAYFTHTTDGKGHWNRKLDYLFTNAQVVPGSGVTYQDEASVGIDTMALSDHAALSFEVQLP